MSFDNGVLFCQWWIRISIFLFVFVVVFFEQARLRDGSSS